MEKISQPEGYLPKISAHPQGKVLVLHAWWGLNETIRQYCNQLSEAGFNAFAPDMFSGKVTADKSAAQLFSEQADEKKILSILDQSIQFLESLNNREQQDTVAVIGFSFGAYFALRLANLYPQINQVVLYYGTGPLDASKSQASYQGHFAENDPFEPPEAVQELGESLTKANRKVDFHTYPGTGHWFAEPDRTEDYHPEAAHLAWKRVLAFLSGKI